MATQPVEVDLDRLTYMLLELDKLHNSAAPSRFPLYAFEKRKKDVANIFEHGQIFYAEEYDQIIGFASVIQKKEKLWIEYLYVQPEFRQKRVATLIIESIFSTFSGQEIFASVYAFNTQAIKFYKKVFNLSSLVFKK